MDAAVQARLTDWLGGVFKESVSLDTVEHLKEIGSVRQTWLLNATVGGKPSQFSLRVDAPTYVFESQDRANEFAVLELLRSQGVSVPKLIASCTDQVVLGAPFTLFETVAYGATFGQQVVNDVLLGGDRRALTNQLGRQLARIHRIEPPNAGLSFFMPADSSPSAAQIANIRRNLDRLLLGRPAIEWGLRWAELNAPIPGRTSLVHGDYRTGNYLVDQSGLVAIVNWQFAGWGDPWSDLGCFCAECWRFGQTHLEAGGIGTREDFYQGYHEESGFAVDDRAVRYWEVIALIRRAVSVLEEGERNRASFKPSLEAALADRLASELELAIVRATAPSAWRNNHGH
jgi:aminoglycoside phosphotransferase (APT) family kinase protein